MSARDIIRSDFLRRGGYGDPAGHWYSRERGDHLADGSHGSYGWHPDHLLVHASDSLALDQLLAREVVTAIADPVGITEIAVRAGVAPTTVTKWRLRHSDFPAPAVRLAAGAIWEWADVASWLADTSRITTKPVKLDP